MVSRRSGFTASFAATLLLALLAFVLTGAAAAGGPPERAIVVLKEGASVERVLADHRASPLHVYRHALRGFTAALTPAARRALAADDRVAYVELDQQVSIYAHTAPTGVQRVFADSNPNVDIDDRDDVRIDVDVAVIDTGIDLQHADLHVVGSTNCTGGGPFSASCGSGGDDDNGHGTHVAGSIAALDDGVGAVGVAPGSRLWAVKVLRSDGSGYLSWIVAGIDWVTARADRIEVANMSLGCECESQAMDDAIARSVDAGVVYAVAAGNSDADASTHSPANHPDVITVSALADFDGEAGGLGSPTCRADQDDTLADFSNFGSTVEIAAPGVCITSTWHDGGYDTISGTSMASPHVAGAAALLASGANDPTSQSGVNAIRSTLIAEGNLSWTDDSGDGAKEPLLDVSDATVFAPATVAGGGGGGGGEEPPPAEGITLSTSAYKVKGVHHVDLAWSGATSTSVDVRRNGVVVATTANDGAYTDNIGKKGGGSYTYKVCEAGTSTCSNEATATF